MTRIYQLDTINQVDIDGTHLVPAEDSSGIDTVRMTLDQLGRYLMCKAGENGEGGLFESQNIEIGNQTFAEGTYNSAVGHYNTAQNDDGGPVSYGSAFGYQNIVEGNWGASAFGYRNHANYSQTSAFGHKNYATDRHASAFGSDNTASGEASLAAGYNNTASGYGNTAVGYSNTASSSDSTAVGYNNDASGGESSAIGHGNESIGGESNAFGWDNTANGGESSAFGCSNTTDGQYSLAIGHGSESFADRSSAIGYQAKSRNEYTVNFGGSIVTRADAGDSSDATFNFAQYSGVQNVVMSQSIDFTTTTSASLNVPTNCTFYVDEISIIMDATTTGITGQPTVKFGWIENDAGHVAAVQTTNLLAAGSREVYGVLTNDGVKTLLATITVAGAGTTQHGRIMWKGVLVEDTPLAG